MKLLIVSETPHHRRGEEIAGWGATVREIDVLAPLFDSVVHLAPLYEGPAPASAQPYRSGSVTLRGLQPAGGSGVRAKLGLLARIPAYWRALWRELGRCDVVHVRTPANICLLALVALTLRRRPRRRWLKFAGNWNPQGPYPWSYRLQRFWLRKGWARGWVTVNGRWPGQPPWVRPFDNPSLDADEEATAAEAAGAKATPPPLHLLFVGALVTTKGVATALRAAAYARQGGLDLTFDIVGDGPERASFESLARDLGLSDVVRFHGWVPRDDVGPFYAAAHLFLLPSHSEGWPKVVSEAMAHGAVPLVSSVSCIPQVLGECGAGETYDFDDAEAFGRGILAYAADAERWRRESRAGVRAARRFTYTHYLDRVRALLSDSPHP